MNKQYIPEYRILKRAGWQVDKQPSIKQNNGSESYPHLIAKTATFKVCHEHGYMADTEVVSDQGYGEIDVLAFAPDKITYAIELETNPDQETIADKKRRYVDSTQAIEEIQVIAVDELPAQMLDMRDRIQTELGFY